MVPSTGKYRKLLIDCGYGGYGGLRRRPGARWFRGWDVISVAAQGPPPPNSLFWLRTCVHLTLRFAALWIKPLRLGGGRGSWTAGWEEVWWEGRQGEREEKKPPHNGIVGRLQRRGVCVRSRRMREWGGAEQERMPERSLGKKKKRKWWSHLY